MSEKPQATATPRYGSRIQEMLAVLSGFPDRLEVCYEASCGLTPARQLITSVIVREQMERIPPQISPTARRLRPWPGGTLWQRVPPCHARPVVR